MAAALFAVLLLPSGSSPALAQDAAPPKQSAIFGSPVPFVPDPAHPPIPLWPGLPPDAAPDASPKTDQVGLGNRLRNISIPTLIPYFPAQKPTHGPAFIFCPGGGYSHVALGGPGNPLADQFNAAGITYFVLKYRQRGAKKAPKLAFEDAQRAVRLVRSRAAEWGLDPHRIVLGGISAGSNLTLHIMAKFDDPVVQPPAPDAVDAVSARPDFAVLLSCWNGHSSDSPYQLTKDAPPLFLRHAQNDHTANIGVSINVAKQMTDLGLPVDYKEYPSGNHGLENDPWPDEFISWLRAQGGLDAAPAGAPSAPEKKPAVTETPAA